MGLLAICFKNDTLCYLQPNPLDMPPALVDHPTMQEFLFASGAVGLLLLCLLIAFVILRRRTR